MHCIMLFCFPEKAFVISLLCCFWRPFSNSKPNEEWPYIALPCHNESEKEILYMKWLIVDRLTRAMLTSLWNVMWNIIVKLVLLYRFGVHVIWCVTKKLDSFSLDKPQVVQDRGRIVFPISAGIGLVTHCVI